LGEGHGAAQTGAVPESREKAVLFSLSYNSKDNTAAASSSGTGFTANKDAIDLLIYGDNASGIRDNVELDGSWAAAGTFSTSALTGSSITFNIYQASGTQVAVQQGLDLTIV
jgi:hypothetical protein